MGRKKVSLRIFRGEHTRPACAGRRPGGQFPSEKIGGTPILTRGTRMLPNFYGMALNLLSKHGNLVRCALDAPTFPQYSSKPVTENLPPVLHQLETGNLKP